MTQGITLEGTVGGGGGGEARSELPVGYCSMSDTPVYSYGDLPRRLYILVSSSTVPPSDRDRLHRSKTGRLLLRLP